MMIASGRLTSSQQTSDACIVWNTYWYKIGWECSMHVVTINPYLFCTRCLSWEWGKETPRVGSVHYYLHPPPLYLVPRAGGEVLRWWVTTTCDNKTPQVITVLMSVSTRVSYCYIEKCRSQMTRYFFNTLERFKVCCRRPSSLSSSVLPYLLSSHVSSLVLFYIAAF